MKDSDRPQRRGGGDGGEDWERSESKEASTADDGVTTLAELNGEGTAKSFAYPL